VFLDQITGSSRAAREVIRRLSQRLRETDDRVVNEERRNGWVQEYRVNASRRVVGLPSGNAYLAARNPWLERQFHTPLWLGELPFVIGRRLVAGERLPPLEPDLMLDDIAPFNLSRNHFTIEKRDGSYHVRDLCSTLGTIVNGELIGGDRFRTDRALLRAGQNEVIAGSVDSPFVFSLFIA
jgi:CRP/FNR family transcriptional regulator, cyclic AMP receptor protein